MITHLPAPYPDKALYQLVLNSGFEQVPGRRANYQKFLNYQRGEKIDFLPVKLDIENVSRCNFRCTMCVVSDWDKGARARDMELEEYRALLDQQFGVTEIKLQGIGEPLMGKSYMAMIEYARKKHIWVRSITNGSQLHINENYKQLIDNDVCEIQISIDSTRTDVYKKIRRGSSPSQIWNNCSQLNQYAKDNDRLRTRMWSLIQHENFSEVEALVELSAKLGFSRHTFATYLEDWGDGRWNEINKEKDVSKNFTSELANRLIKKGQKLGVEVTFWGTADRFKLESKESLCPWPFERAVISSDMKVVPCCVVGNPDIYSLGEAENFKDVWFGEKYENFRQMHIKGDLPSICRNCYHK